MSRPAVLVVNDEPIVRKLFMAALPPEGFDVLTAASAEEATALLRGDPGRVAVALLEFELPGTAGPQLLAELRRVAPALPACFLSGGAASPRLEGVPVLACPCPLNEIVRTLRRQIRPAVG